MPSLAVRQILRYWDSNFAALLIVEVVPRFRAMVRSAVHSASGDASVSLSAAVVFASIDDRIQEMIIAGLWPANDWNFRNAVNNGGAPGLKP